MTKDEMMGVKPGDRLLILDHFVMDPDDSVREFLGTVQVVKSIDSSGDGWVNFENVPQPFAFCEIVCMVGDVECIDEDAYDPEDIMQLFGEVTSW